MQTRDMEERSSRFSRKLGRLSLPPDARITAGAWLLWSCVHPRLHLSSHRHVSLGPSFGFTRFVPLLLSFPHLIPFRRRESQRQCSCSLAPMTSTEKRSADPRVRSISGEVLMLSPPNPIDTRV